MRRRHDQEQSLGDFAAPSEQSLLNVRLTAVRYVARDTHLLELRAAAGSHLPPAEPGAHVGIHLTNGLVRQYSLATCEGPPRAYEIAVKREASGRGGSRYIHDQLRVGTLLKIESPRNNFPLDENAAHSVLIAGGIGITPIRAMQRRLHALKRSYDLYYACRSREDCAFLEELENLAQIRLHFDAEAGAVLDIGNILAAAPSGSHLYCCGPVPMLTAFEQASAGWPRSHVHVEYFSPKLAASVEGGYTVRLARSGLELEVTPGRTILQVLLEAGIDVPFSCEQGVCGSCETRVLAGTPDHRDAILSDEERAANKTMLVCCSGSKTSQLVLDL
jgi:tetrachlorobenzoquinone reductase